MDQNQDIKKLTGILKRRKAWLFVPFLATVAIAVTVALLLPNVYRSTATILINNRQVPENLVPSTITSYADQRIQAITQEVTSRSKILKLVDEYGLLPGKREKLTTDDLVERVKSRIQVKPINAEINQGSGGRKSELLIAFSLSFDDEDPRKAQAVANELASFYQEKNLEAREKRARGTTRFLEEQLAHLKTLIDSLENKLSAFRKQHMEQLPEFASYNMQKVEQLQSTINEMSQQIRSLQGQRTIVNNQLALVDPYAGGDRQSLSPEERLRQAQLEKTQLVARYSARHPLVKAKEREIALLTRQVKGKGGLTSLRKRLKELELERAKLEARYSDNHPSVRRLDREIEELRTQLSVLETMPDATGKAAARAPTNPAYVALKTDLGRIDIKTASLSQEKKTAEKQLKALYAKLQAMPEVAKQYNDLVSDLNIKKRHYEELQDKYLAARVAQGVEEEQLGETFQVVEPAFLPQKPYKPNRLAIILIGCVLGIGLSVGLTAVREFTDSTLHDSETLKKASGLPVLCRVPSIVTARDRQRRLRRRLALSATVVSSLVLAVVAFHFLVMDLYIFYAKLLRLLQSHLTM